MKAEREREIRFWKEKKNVIGLLQNNLTQRNLTKECYAFLRFSSKWQRQKMQFTSSGVPACSFCLNRYRSQLGSTNIRAEGLSSDPVLCEYFGQMVETLLTGPTLALIVSPNGSLVYTALHILLKTGIHNFCPDCLPQFAVCRSWH